MGTGPRVVGTELSAVGAAFWRVRDIGGGLSRRLRVLRGSGAAAEACAVALALRGRHPILDGRLLGERSRCARLGYVPQSSPRSQGRILARALPERVHALGSDVRAAIGRPRAVRLSRICRAAHGRRRSRRGRRVWALGPDFRRGNVARFWLFGTLFAVLPIAASPPGDRLLSFVGIGSAALVANIVKPLVDASSASAARGLVCWWRRHSVRCTWCSRCSYCRCVPRRCRCSVVPWRKPRQRSIRCPLSNSGRW